MDMKKASARMSLLMGLCMSCTLTLVGLLSSGQLTFTGFIVNFITSFIISQLLGLILPAKKITDDFSARFNLPPGKLSTRLLETLVSDLLYSPLMTLIMVFIAWRQAVSHGARIPFGPMLLKAECISFIGAYIMIFFVTPVLTRLVFGDSPKQR